MLPRSSQSGCAGRTRAWWGSDGCAGKARETACSLAKAALPAHCVHAIHAGNTSRGPRDARTEIGARGVRQAAGLSGGGSTMELDPVGTRKQCCLRHARALAPTRLPVIAASRRRIFFQKHGGGGGWQTYLQRSDDFTRMCCHGHLPEMPGTRDGAGKTRVVWSWSNGR